MIRDTCLVTMSETTHLSMPGAAPLYRLESTAATKRSLEMSPSRSSVCSTSSQSQAHTPPSSVPNTPLLLPRSSSLPKGLSRPADSSFFLTALAAQERRVLELREELLKANEELEQLKKQWAMHEATKKKNELRHLQQLQPLNTPPLGSSTPDDEESVRAGRELGRRRILSSTRSNKPSHRKVFPGSRHTRALSLLAPKDPRGHSDLPPCGNGPPIPHQPAANDVGVPAIVPNLSSLDVVSSTDHSTRVPQTDILETSKQLVGDFRQGLWTFFEDFKQLTVGDEGISGAGHRNPTFTTPGNMSRPPNLEEKRPVLKASPAMKAGASNVVQEIAGQSPIEVSAPKESTGILLGRPTEPFRPTSTTTDYSFEGGIHANSSDSDNDGWNNWDTPKGSTSRREEVVDQNKPKHKHEVSTFGFVSSRKSMLRTLESSCDATPLLKNRRISNSDNGGIPWPTLTKSAPGTLKMSVSTLMSEWERSLAPKVQEEVDPWAHSASIDNKTA